jgi:hypothetical protein
LPCGVPGFCAAKRLLSDAEDGAGEFVFGAGFPAAVDPEVLGGVVADEVFDAFGVAGGDVVEFVFVLVAGVILPVFGVDDVLGADIEFEFVAAAAGVADDDGEIVLDGEEADGFVGAGESSEEGDEHAFGAGVLVGDEAEGAFFVEDVEGGGGDAAFGEDDLAFFLADAEEPGVDVGVVDGAGDGVGFEAEGGEGVAEDFPVAVVAGDEDGALAAKEDFEGVGEAVEVDVVVPVFGIDEAGGEEDVHDELDEVLHGAFGDLFEFVVGFFGEAGAEVFEGAFAVLAVDLVEEGADEAGGGEVGVDGEEAEEHGDGASGDVLGEVDEGGEAGGFGHEGDFSGGGRRGRGGVSEHCQGGGAIGNLLYG